MVPEEDRGRKPVSTVNLLYKEKLTAQYMVRSMNRRWPKSIREHCSNLNCIDAQYAHAFL